MEDKIGSAKEAYEMQRIKNIIQELTPMDDVFFEVLMKNKKVCEEIRLWKMV